MEEKTVARLPIDIISDIRINSEDFRVFSILFNSNQKISVMEMSRIAGISIKKIKKSIKKLDDLGIYKINE